jgi:hypothetical protein
MDFELTPIRPPIRSNPIFIPHLLTGYPGCRSLLYLDGPLLVDDDGLHGMVERCGSQQLAAGAHSLYIAGFQAGGGVGMQLRYSGPDTAGRKLFVMPGAVAAPQRLRSGSRRRPVLSSSRGPPAISGAEVGKATQAPSALMRNIYELTRRLKMQVQCPLWGTQRTVPDTQEEAEGRRGHGNSLLCTGSNWSVFRSCGHLSSTPTPPLPLLFGRDSEMENCMRGLRL